MSPEMGRAALRLAMFSVVVALVLLPLLEQGSAEFVITVASLVLGLVFAGLVWLMARRLSK